MNALYLTRQDGEKILVQDYISIIGRLPGIQDLKTKNVFRASAEADYKFEDDQTILRLNENQETIIITGIGKASVRAAFKIQAGYAHPLRIFDADYSFDFVLRGIANIQNLEKMMSAGIKSAEPT